MGLPFPFDYKNPDYVEVFEWRLENLKRLREHMKSDPTYLPQLKSYYDKNTVAFINDWGMTYDPRNSDIGLPPLLPFILYPKQEEFVEWFEERWSKREDGLVEKSRGVGISCEVGVIAGKHALFRSNISVGFTSYQERLVDKVGDSGSLLYKIRQFIQLLPVEFRGSWDAKKHSAHLRIDFPETGSLITGAIGDNMFRGDRKSFIFVDEHAHMEHADEKDKALSYSSNCRIYISTPKGNANLFAKKRFSGKLPVFTMRWQEDPRVDEEWYRRECERFDDPVLIAQELDLDYSASVEGIIIPPDWVQAAINSHIVLNIDISKSPRWASFDIADEGSDKNAFMAGQGVYIEYIEEWSGKGSDIYQTTEKALTLAELYECEHVIYDADGMGAGVRGDARVLLAQREKEYYENSKFSRQRYVPIEFIPFTGSGEVVDKDKEAFPPRPGVSSGKYTGRTNGDFFGNAKAQSWYGLARRFRNTYRAVVEKQPFDPDDIVSISKDMAGSLKLIRELSQPTREFAENGKMYVNKKPDGMPSPNYADCAMMRFAKVKTRPRNFFDV